LVDAGLDAGADTIGWHLTHRHHVELSRATIKRILVRAGTVTPDPSKRPKSSYTRFEADQPNECWQSDFTHYRLTNTDGSAGSQTEIIIWLDDHARYALHLSAHPRITAQIVLQTFRQACDLHGYPASTLTDTGMVYTTRYAGGRGGRNHLEHELRHLDIVQKNSRPNHPTTCGKVERFQQTLKKWLRAQPRQPTTIAELQTLLD
jgi:transposase InsO family protein